MPSGIPVAVTALGDVCVLVVFGMRSVAVTALATLTLTYETHVKARLRYQQR